MTSSRLRTKGWTIAAALVTLALVPAALMLIVVNIALYATALRDVDTDIEERGRLIVDALAEGSRYGVVSGNTRALSQTVRGLMGADRSVVRIRVLDDKRDALLSVGDETSTAELRRFESPILAGALDVNLFDTARAAETGVIARRPDMLLVGFVEISMSSEPLVAAMRRRLLGNSLIVLMAALCSAAVGLALARRLRRPLGSILEGLRGIRAGHYDLSFAPGAGGEVGELQDTIVEMAQGLKGTYRNLENEVAIRTEALAKAADAARAADAEKGRLIARGNVLVEEERRLIALELHDDLNSLLVAVRLQAGSLAAAVRDGHQVDAVRGAERINELVGTVYDRSRTIVQRLRPEVIDTLGLAGAIEETVRLLDEADPQCTFRFETDNGVPALSVETAITAYRVVQEALSNTVKHASATRCLVTVYQRTDIPGVEVSVRDNGHGFDTSDRQTGVGLVGMRERIAALRGALTVESIRGQGTSVTIQLPALG